MELFVGGDLFVLRLTCERTWRTAYETPPHLSGHKQNSVAVLGSTSLLNI